MNGEVKYPSILLDEEIAIYCIYSIFEERKKLMLIYFIISHYITFSYDFFV